MKVARPLPARALSRGRTMARLAARRIAHGARVARATGNRHLRRPNVRELRSARGGGRFRLVAGRPTGTAAGRPAEAAATGSRRLRGVGDAMARDGIGSRGSRRVFNFAVAIEV